MGIGSVVTILVVAVGLNVIPYESMGQSVGCTTALISLSPCLSFITSSSSSSTPSSSCCSRLANVVQSQPRCLCSALNGGAAASLGVTIDPTRALALPTACHLQTPPPSRCNDVSGSMAPTTSPVSSPKSSPNIEYFEDEEEDVETPTTTTWEDSNFA